MGDDIKTEPAVLQPAIRVVMMPRDTNPLGTIFGGVILSYIDQAGAIEAHKHSEKNLVTVAMHEVKFIAPVFVGDLVSFYTELLKIGTTSVTVRVTVEARRRQPPHETARVTQAEVVYVAVSATKLATDSKAVLDKVIKHGATAEVERHGKPVAQIEPAVGASREEIVELLDSIDFTKEETQELKKAMDAANDMFGYAGGA
jgi:acyl-CoA thioesterase YciA